MKSRLWLEALIEWTAVACVATVFIAAALDAPDDAVTRKPVPVSPADRSK